MDGIGFGELAFAAPAREVPTSVRVLTEVGHRGGSIDARERRERATVRAPLVTTLPLLATVVKVYTYDWPYSRDMGDTERMGIKEIRANLGQRIDAAYFLGEQTTLTKNNQDRAAIVPLSVVEKAKLADRYAAKYGPLDEAE